MQKTAKKVTLNGLSDKVDKLATTMEAGFKRMDAEFKRVDAKMDAGFKRVDAKMDAGFKRADNKMDAGFNKAEENRESLARMIANGFEDVMQRIGRVGEGQTRIEQGQENIQLRLDSLAPYFEVKQLERRVKRLEDRAGIRHVITH